MAPYSLSKGPDVISVSATVAEDSVKVTAAASDSELSSSNHPTSQQGVAEIRLFVNEHPNEGQYGTQFAGTSVIIDISVLPPGRHIVYLHATDSEGYKGPITAAYFTKEDGLDLTPSTRSPVATTLKPVGAPSTPTLSPVTTTTPAEPVLLPTAPIGSTTISPIAPPATADSGSCADHKNVFYVHMIEMYKDCQWLSVNTVRFSYLCDSLEVAAACPETCSHCEYFS